MDEPRPPDLEEILAELHEDARGRIKEDLLPGERLLWAARSHRDPVRAWGYVFAILLLVTFAIGSVASFRYAFSQARFGANPPDSLVAMGILFGIAAAVVGIGGMATIHGAVHKRWTRSQHLYAITNRRVIMRTPTFDRLGIEVRAHELPALGTLHRTEYPDGLGTLTFSVKTGPRAVDPEHGVVDQFDSYRLEKIPDIRRVELLLRQAVSESTLATASSNSHDVRRVSPAHS